MEEKIELIDQEIGKAIVQFIGLKKGQSFFPYRIKTTLKVPKQVEFELEPIPKGTKSGEYPHVFGEKD